MPITAYGKDYGRITCPKAEMYENAAENSRIVGNVIKEMEFEIKDSLQDEEGNNWLYIKPDNGIEGYILAEQVEKLPVQIKQQCEQVRSLYSVCVLLGIKIKKLKD